jgi:hypothetical protein
VKKILVALAGTFSLTSLSLGVASATPPHTQTVTATLLAANTKNAPLVRVTFPTVIRASALPALRTDPVLATKWVQRSPHVVEAVLTKAPQNPFGYLVSVPSAYQCAAVNCTLAASKATMTTTQYSFDWAMELLARLKYLPLMFVPSLHTSNLVVHVPGHYRWLFAQISPNLKPEFRVAGPSVVMTGAVMSFQNAGGLPTTGVVDAATWAALLAAGERHAYDPMAYTYVRVAQTLPQQLTLFIAGRPVFHALVNTGIPASPTQPGTFPVYLRFQTTTMSGTNPNGTYYHDTGIPWVSYFNGGDALHGFLRSSYGSPQSLGCVEMTFADAGKVWPHTPIGTLVTVLP